MADFPWGSFAATVPFTALAVLVVLGVTFAVALQQHKHAVVDVTWGLGFVAIALVAAMSGHLAAAPDSGDGRRWLVLVLTAAWGLRLAVHVGLRSRGHGEDPRYEELMARAPGNPNLYAFQRIYLTQGVVMWFISLPVQVAAFETPGVNLVTWLGVLVWVVGFTFESVGDWQLTRFRNDPSTKGQVLSTGLWRYTRHPNYFGDACAWWGLSLVAFTAWPGVLTILSPLAMTWLLAKGTGKPLLEKDMSSRRPGYADYVRRTSGFVPLPPKKLAPSRPHPTEEIDHETITEGTKAPDFELPDQHGGSVRLSEKLADGPVVLFFYPIAMTGGCTKEACHFRDLAGEFSSAGAQRLGISTDPVAKQKEFSDMNSFDYPLLSDESGDVATSFGVKRKYVTPVKRATFVIDRDLTVAKVITSEMNMDVHADQALAALKAL